MSCCNNSTDNENDDCQKTYLLTNVAVIKNIKRIKIQKMKEQNRRRETIIVTIKRPQQQKIVFFSSCSNFNPKAETVKKK